jgi:hypothetical protein
MRYLPLAAALACLILFRRADVNRAAAFLLIVVVAHAVVTDLARGEESEVRYAIPVEPSYCILLLAGLSRLRRPELDRRPER